MSGCRVVDLLQREMPKSQRLEAQRNAPGAGETTDLVVAWDVQAQQYGFNGFYIPAIDRLLICLLQPV